MPSVPNAGADLEIDYNAKGGPLGGMNNIVAIVYTYDDYVWHAHDVDLTNVGDNVWKGHFSVPTTAAALGIKFQHTLSMRPDSIDSGEVGWISQVLSGNKKLPGAYLGPGLGRVPSLGFSIPGFFNSNFKELDDKNLNMWVQSELMNFPTYTNRYFNQLKALAPKLAKGKPEDTVKELADNLNARKDKSEEDYMNLYYTYWIDLRDNAKADSLKKVILKKYPKGNLARRDALMKLGATRDSATYMKEFRKFEKEFPIEDAYAFKDRMFYQNGQNYRRYAVNLFTCKKYDELIAFIPKMDFRTLTDAYSHGPQQALKFDTDPKEYIGVAKAFIKEMEKKATDLRYVDDIQYSPKQLVNYNTEATSFYKNVYCEIARRCGDWNEVISAFESIPDTFKYNLDARGNEAYITALQKVGRDADAIKAMEASASSSKMTPAVYAMLQDHYEKSNPKPAKTFDEYFNSLKSHDTLSAIQEHVKKSMVNDPYHPFSLHGMTSVGVDSKTFDKDDIVVLDFWATWCAPCVAALEGMKMAVNKYKDDKHVKFYFVDTQDNVSDDVIKQFWKKKGYGDDMPVVRDAGKSENDKRPAEVYSDMFPNASGIPQKAILKNGRVRYRASGYSGSPSGLMDEISAAIEILKNEK